MADNHMKQPKAPIKPSFRHDPPKRKLHGRPSRIAVYSNGVDGSGYGDYDDNGYNVNLSKRFFEDLEEAKTELPATVQDWFLEINDSAISIVYYAELENKDFDKQIASYEAKKAKFEERMVKYEKELFEYKLQLKAWKAYQSVVKKAEARVAEEAEAAANAILNKAAAKKVKR